jgi:hypothetical protein
MLRKTFRHYDIDNIIVTVSRGMLQLNPDLTIECSTPAGGAGAAARGEAEPDPPGPEENPPPPPRARHLLVSGRRLPAGHRPAAGGIQLFGGSTSHPITLTQMNHSQCELLASDEMLRSVSGTAYGKNFDEVRQRLKLGASPANALSSSMATGWKPTAWAGYSSPTARCMKTTRSATAITIFTTPGSRNETRPAPFSPSLPGIYRRRRVQRLEAAAGENDGVMSCSTKAIMRFETWRKRTSTAISI